MNYLYNYDEQIKNIDTDWQICNNGIDYCQKRKALQT
jgi:hypothetical protein